MSDFTGFDPTKAISDLRKFETAISKIFFKAKEQFESYNSTLKDYWASPKAVEYNSDMIIAPSEIGYEISSIAERIISSATRAIKRVAITNGSNFDYTTPKVSSWDYDLLKPSLSDGEVGMKVNQAGELVEQYISNLERTKNELESLPTDLALYDKESNLKQLFTNLIKKETEKINDIIDKLSKTINEVKDLEQASLEKAVSSAEFELSSNTNTNIGNNVYNSSNVETLKQKEQDFTSKVNAFRELINKNK